MEDQLEKSFTAFFFLGYFYIIQHIKKTNK